MLPLDENFMYWIAGLFEGEASFMKPAPSAPFTPTISLHMTDEDIVAKVAQTFGISYNHIPAGKAHWRLSYSLHIKGKNAIKVMRCLAPVMSQRRQQQIERAMVPRWYYVKPQFVLEPPKKHSLNELLWVAGLLEGEGSFLASPPSDPNTPRVQMWSTDEDVIQRLSKMWQLSYATYERGGNAKIAYFIMLRGKRAVDLMMLLKPLMGIRRQQQIDTALAGYDPNLSRNTQIARSPFTMEQVRDIKKRLSAGEKVSKIANDYGVKYRTVRRIATGERWAWLE